MLTQQEQKNDAIPTRYFWICCAMLCRQTCDIFHQIFISAFSGTQRCGNLFRTTGLPAAEQLKHRRLCGKGGRRVLHLGFLAFWVSNACRFQSLQNAKEHMIPWDLQISIVLCASWVGRSTRSWKGKWSLWKKRAAGPESSLTHG